jgi:hypothetical protein
MFQSAGWLEIQAPNAGWKPAVRWHRSLRATTDRSPGTLNNAPTHSLIASLDQLAAGAERADRMRIARRQCAKAGDSGKARLAGMFAIDNAALTRAMIAHDRLRAVISHNLRRPILPNGRQGCHQGECQQEWCDGSAFDVHVSLLMA